MSTTSVEILSLATWETELLKSVRGLRYGSVEVTVHAGRVVQIERREKVRYETDRRRPDERARELNDDEQARRASGGAASALAEEKR